MKIKMSDGSSIRALAVASALVVCVQPAMASPVTYRCSFVDGSSGGTYAKRVNQLIVDVLVPFVELRVAETIGTRQPLNYRFTDNKPDRLAVADGDAEFVAGGIRFGTPFAIRLDKTSGVVVWQYIDGTRPEFNRFRCRR